MSPTNLSRRAILAGAAAVPALAFPAVVAVAAPVSAAIQPIAGRNPDAELFELVEQYIAAHAEHGRRIDEVAPFEERMWAHHSAAEKARPDVLRTTPADRALGLPQPFLDRDENEKERFYDSRTVDNLRKEKWTVVKEANQQGQITIVLNPNVIPSPEARARADEIVQTFDAWFEKYNKRPRGLRAAERRCAAACSKSLALNRRIAAIRAQTLEGLIAKVRCVQLGYRDGNLKQHFDDAHEIVGHSIMVDLVDLKSKFAAVG